jgi:osmotically-inducible protein OsmY
MNLRPIALAVSLAATATLGMTSGCSVANKQETVGSYIDDASITASVKSKLVEDKTVDASAIHVETLNGTVQLSGFAKTAAEKEQAEVVTRRATGVKSVKNDIVVRG